MRKIFKIFNLSVSLLTLSIWSAVGYYSEKLPDSFYVEAGTSLSISSAENISAVINESEAASSDTSETLPVSRTASLRLFGVLPVKNVEVLTVDTPMLTPCGTAFGIKLLMDGVMVVGMGEVQDENGKSSCPAKDCGICEGDVITSVAGKDVSSNQDVQVAIEDSESDTVKVDLIRDNCNISVLLKPVFSNAGTYQAGMWVRDSSAGIGTVTYYNEATNEFGGLGHPICDTDTGEILPLSSGEAMGVKITDVVKGVSGNPGALQGTFIARDDIGLLSKNNKCGLFGKLYENPSNEDAIPLGLKQEITTGEAKILTTIDNGGVQEFTINIDEIDYKNTDSSKNMVITITDKDLLEETGGIVQGMSGSPIIQNGKLVGAVTHVFVNEPTRGYAVFAESMYEMSK